MIDEIRKNAPSGATAYIEFEGRIYYFFKSNYGWRQIKENLIQFDDSDVNHLLKPLY